VFLSVFKWEYRKGWDVLLKSYLKEFSKDDWVALYLLTNPYHTDMDFGNKILDFMESSDMVEPVSGWAPEHVIDTHIALRKFPRFFLPEGRMGETTGGGHVNGIAGYCDKLVRTN